MRVRACVCVWVRVRACMCVRVFGEGQGASDSNVLFMTAPGSNIIRLLLFGLTVPFKCPCCHLRGLSCFNLRPARLPWIVSTRRSSAPPSSQQWRASLKKLTQLQKLICQSANPRCCLLHLLSTQTSRLLTSPAACWLQQHIKRHLLASMLQLDIHHLVSHANITVLPLCALQWH